MGNVLTLRIWLQFFAVIKFYFVIAVGLGCFTLNELKELEQRLLSTPAAPETQALYRDFLINTDVERLKELMASEFNVVAVQAAWELFVLTSKDAGKIETRRELLSRHIGFLEGRLRVPIPNWWANETIGHEPNDNTNLKYKTTGVSGISCPADMSINEIDNVYRISQGKDSVELSKDSLSDLLANGPWQANCTFTSDFFYLVVHDSYGRPCSLACFDRKSGISRWRSTVYGCSWGITSGPAELKVSIEENADRIAVFGIGSHGAFIQVCNAETGNALSLFSTGWSQK